MTTKRHLTTVTTTITTTVDDDGRLPHDPAHPTLDNAPRYPIAEPHVLKVRHDASDEWQNLTARAVFIDDCFTGPILELGPWSMSPLEARQLGDALRGLAAELDPRLA
ncbi:hypothetical protein GS446_05380 [Rhodococcus hoagii]|nr:hypothetical protein [Prescottella equi]